MDDKFLFVSKFLHFLVSQDKFKETSNLYNMYVGQNDVHFTGGN